jgi:hypothetical protein
MVGELTARNRVDMPSRGDSFLCMDFTSSRWLPMVLLTCSNLFLPFARAAKPAGPAPEARQNVACGEAAGVSAPYSPDFNPIENLWSKVEAGLKSRTPRTAANCSRPLARR